MCLLSTVFIFGSKVHIMSECWMFHAVLTSWVIFTVKTSLEVSHIYTSFEN